MPFTIRRATPADAESICAVHIASIRQVCSACYTEQQIDAWAGRKTPARYIPLIDAGRVVVADEDGAIIGLGQLGAGRDEIEAVYVRPDRLRQGVGRALMGALEDEALRHGASHLTLHASLNAEPFYLAAGYTAVRRSTHSLGPGIELECIDMIRSFRRSSSTPG